MVGGPEEPNPPGVVRGDRLRHRRCHGDFLTTAGIAGLLSDRRGHRDSRALVVAAEDVAGQAPKPRICRLRFRAWRDVSLGADPNTISPDLEDGGLSFDDE